MLLEVWSTQPGHVTLCPLPEIMIVIDKSCENEERGERLRGTKDDNPFQHEGCGGEDLDFSRFWEE